MALVALSVPPIAGKGLPGTAPPETGGQEQSIYLQQTLQEKTKSNVFDCSKSFNDRFLSRPGLNGECKDGYI
jgi:hypothetical protein